MSVSVAVYVCVCLCGVCLCVCLVYLILDAAVAAVDKLHHALQGRIIHGRIDRNAHNAALGCGQHVRTK